MEHLSILPGGEDHLWLEAGLEEAAMSHHRAASATVGGRREDISVSIRQRHSRSPLGETAVRVSSLATRHLLLISSCCKIEALIRLSSSSQSHSPSLSHSLTSFKVKKHTAAQIEGLSRADPEKD